MISAMRLLRGTEYLAGDKSNHEASLNFPQLFYFLAFLQVFTLPLTSIFEALREGPDNLRYMGKR